MRHQIQNYRKVTNSLIFILIGLIWFTYRPTDYFSNQDINNRNSKTESVATERQFNYQRKGGKFHCCS